MITNANILGQMAGGVITKECAVPLIAMSVSMPRQIAGGVIIRGVLQEVYL